MEHNTQHPIEFNTRSTFSSLWFYDLEFSNPTVNIIVNKMVTLCVSVQQSMRIWETVKIFSRKSFEFHISGPLTTAAVASLSSIFSTYATMTKH